MKILVDQNIPPNLVAQLKEEVDIEVINIQDVLDSSPHPLSHEQIHEYASGRDLVLLTGNYIFLKKDPEYGVLFHHNPVAPDSEVVAKIKHILNSSGKVTDIKIAIP